MKPKIGLDEFLKAMEDYHGEVLQQTDEGFTAEEYAGLVHKNVGTARLLIKEAYRDGKIEVIGYRRVVCPGGKLVRVKAYAPAKSNKKEKRPVG